MIRRRISKRFRRSPSRVFWAPRSSDGVPTVLDGLLQENGDDLLLEDGSRVLMEV